MALPDMVERVARAMLKAMNMPGVLTWDGLSDAGRLEFMFMARGALAETAAALAEMYGESDTGPLAIRVALRGPGYWEVGRNEAGGMSAVWMEGEAPVMTPKIL